MVVVGPYNGINGKSAIYNCTSVVEHTIGTRKHRKGLRLWEVPKLVKEINEISSRCQIRFPFCCQNGVLTPLNPVDDADAQK